MLINNFKSLAALIMFGKSTLLYFDTENISANMMSYAKARIEAGIYKLNQRQQ